MDHFLDEAARALASPMHRRQAVKRLGTALLAAIVAPLFGGRAEAGSPPDECKKDETACGTGKDGCCKKGQICCSNCAKPFCATPKKGCPSTGQKC